MIATTISVSVIYYLERKIPFVPLIGASFVVIFGGLTIYFDNPVFIYIKPTIINILFGLALIFGKYFTNEPVLKKLMGKSVSLTNEGWEILNRRWVYFFFGLAILNELVWRTQSEEFWVNFKVWGLLPITFIFTAFQISLINKYNFIKVDNPLNFLEVIIISELYANPDVCDIKCLNVIDLVCLTSLLSSVNTGIFANSGRISSAGESKFNLPVSTNCIAARAVIGLLIDINLNI